MQNKNTLESSLSPWIVNSEQDFILRL